MGGQPKQISTTPRRKKGKSRLLETVAPPAHAGSLAITTDGLSAVRLNHKPTPELSLTEWSMGDPREVAPSSALWGRSKWELHVLLTVRNGLPTDLTIHDLHANTYHVDGFETPLAMMVLRARIEISLDNSITADGIIKLAPGEVQPLDIVLETSLYDTIMTTIVFGLVFDARTYSKASQTEFRLPSDCIYVFQQHPMWGIDKYHFKRHDQASIEHRRNEDPANKELQQFCLTLREANANHRSLADKLSHVTLMSREISEPSIPGAATRTARRLSTDVKEGLEALAKECQAAVDLLCVCGFFDTRPIPSILMREAFYQLSLQLYRLLVRKADEYIPPSSHRSKRKPPDASPGAVPENRVLGLTYAEDTGDGLYHKIRRLNDGTNSCRQAIEHLLSFGFLTTNSEGTLYTVPEHVRAVVLKRLIGPEKMRWLECGMQAVSALIPAGGAHRSDWDEAIGVVPHARSCIEWSKKLDVEALFDKDVRGIVFFIAGHLVDVQMYVEAIPFLRWVLVELEEAFGSEDKKVADELLYLAEALRINKEYDEAEKLFSRAEGILLASEGPGGAGYALCLHNRATIYRDLGRYGDAEPLFKQALPVIKRSLSSGQIDQAINDYALLLAATGRNDEAAKLRKSAKGA
jgi:tetratricopeptide (TPR) repeat protein